MSSVQASEDGSDSDATHEDGSDSDATHEDGSDSDVTTSQSGQDDVAHGNNSTYKTAFELELYTKVNMNETADVLKRFAESAKSKSVTLSKVPRLTLSQNGAASVDERLDSVMQSLLAPNNADVNRIDRRLDGSTPLRFAMQNNRWAAVERLLELNAETRGDDFSVLVANKGLLQEIVERGYPRLLCLLLNNGLRVDAEYGVRRWSYEALPLVVHASSVGSVEIIRVLVNSGVDVNPNGMRIPTCLHVATYGRHVAVIKLLLDNVRAYSKHEYISRRDRTNRSALFYAAMEGYADAATALLSHGATVSALLEDEDGRTALHAACYDNHAAVAAVLLEGVDEGRKAEVVDARDWSGRTALMHACRQGYATVVELLLRHGANMTAADARGWTCLHEACLNQHGAVVYLVLCNLGRLGRNATDFVRRRTDEHRDALYYAISGGCASIVARVMFAGADMFSVYKNKQTCLHIACAHNRSEVLRVLIATVPAEDRVEFVNAGDDCRRNALFYACKWGNREIASVLLRAGVDVSARDHNGQTCLHSACEEGFVELLALLVNSVDGDDSRRELVNSIDDAGHDCLFVAGERDRVDVVTALVGYGADVGLQDELGQTCLHRACIGKRVEVVEALMSSVDPRCKEEFVNIQDGEKRRALYYAAKKAGRKSEMVCLLLQNGALDDF